MADRYVKKLRKAIKDSSTDDEIDTVLNKAYEDGFQDGANEK